MIFAQSARGVGSPKAMVAEAVDASRPKINRCLKALERRGVIALHNGSLPEMRDRVALTDLL